MAPAGLLAVLDEGSWPPTVWSALAWVEVGVAVEYVKFVVPAALPAPVVPLLLLPPQAATPRQSATAIPIFFMGDPR
jgi:hypothetical protein